MANTGFTEVYVTDWDTLKFTWWIDNQDIAANSTSLGWKMELVATAYGYITPLYNRYWSATVNGQFFEGRVNINIGNWQTVQLATGFVDIPHNADGSKTFSYSFSQNLNIVFSDVQINTIYGNGTGVIDAIPRAATITTAPNFTDEQNPTINYSNPAGDAVDSLQVCIASDTGGTIYVPYRDVSLTGSTYTFSLTDAERKTLRQAATRNVLSIRFYIKTELGGDEYRNYSLPKAMTIINATPTLNPTVRDINVSSLSITGDSTGQTVIKGINIMEYSIGAAAYKEATIVEQYIQCGSIKKTTASGEMNNVEDYRFYVYAKDSRGNEVSEPVNLNFVDYTRLTCNQEVRIMLVNETQARVELTIKGNYYPGSFGATNNDIWLSYKYSTNGGAYGDLIRISEKPTIDTAKHTYTLTHIIEGLNYDDTYEFVSRAADMPMIIESNSYPVKLSPTFDWGENDFNFNVPIHMNGSTVLRATDTNRLVVSANGGDIYLRPNGSTTDAGQLRVLTDGRLALNGVVMGDFIVEQNIITYQGKEMFYRKWNSGLYEVDCNIYGEPTADIADTVFLPLYLVEEPMVIMGISDGEYGYDYHSGYHDYGDAIEIYCYNPSFTGDWFYSSIKIIGKWK